MQKLLRYLINSVLAGEEERLKESVIGVEVFDRPADFDPKTDSIVRVEMRRMRTKLAGYYADEGKADEIVVWLEKGDYVPLLLVRSIPDVRAFSGVDAIELQPVAVQPDVFTLPSVGTVALSTSPVAGRTSTPRRFGMGLIWTATAVGIVLAGALLLRISSSTGRHTAGPPRLFPLTGNAGVELNPEFSPDSKAVAYCWDGNRRNLDIYVRSLSGDAAHRITDNAAHDVHPSWSPDGKQLAFLRVFPDKSQFVIVPAHGGIEVVVDENIPSLVGWHPDVPEAGGSIGPIWSPDGSSLLVGATWRNDVGRGIRRIYLSGRREIVTVPPEGASDGNPTISPSGKYMAFIRSWAFNSSDVYWQDAEGGKEPRQVTLDRSDVEGVAWLDNEHLIFSSSRYGTPRLWKIARDGGEPQLVPVGGARPKWPAISRDHHWLAFVDADNSSNIWRTSLRNITPQDSAEPLISSAGEDNSPAYSPDGRKIVFVSNRSGKRQLWLSDSDGADVRQLGDFGGETLGTPRWSPDGQRIVFDGSHSGKSSIWLIGRDGSNMHRLNNSEEIQYLPSWSSDGQWVYFVSLRRNNEALWKQRLDNGEAKLVIAETLFDAAESPTRSLIFAQRAKGGIWQMGMDGGDASAVPEISYARPARYWTLARDKLFFVRHEQSPKEVEEFDLETRKIRKVFTIPGNLIAGTPGLSISPDGAEFLFVQRNKSRSSIMLEERRAEHE